MVSSAGSNFDELLFGSKRSLDYRDGAVNGVRSNQNNVTLDGADVNDQQNQTPFMSVVPISVDSLQEFRVTTSNSGADAGGAGGGQVAMVTKSGSNDLHGNVRWFHRNDAFSANGFFNKAQTPATDTPKLIRNLGGASAGGPIVQNRFFFFVDYELRRDASEENVARIVPSDTIKQGILTYACDTADPLSATLCPNGTFQLTPAQIAAMDPRAFDTSGVCDPASTTGCGVNPFMLTYLSQFPQGLDATQGLDVGLNFIGSRFNAPIKTDNNLYTVRLDANVTADGSHKVFWRGSLADVKVDILPAHFPGRPPSAVLLNNGKGFSASYTGQVSPTLINRFTYGFTRGGIEQSGTAGPAFTIEGLDPNTNFNRAFGRRMPTHDFKNDVTWIRGNHSVQFGANYRRIENNRFTNDISFPRFIANNLFCLNFCRDVFNAVVNDPNLPAPVNSNQFTLAHMMLTGSITLAQASFFVDPSSLTFLPEGTPQARRYRENDFEWYIQDIWRLRNDLTLTLGLRHSYFGPIWESGGSMVKPVQDFQQWWNQRSLNLRNGIPVDANPLLQWELAGKANGTSAWWDPDVDNFSPRVALAWSPSFDGGMGRVLFGGPGMSSIRAGWGMYYGRVGSALALQIDQWGSPGMSNRLIGAPTSSALRTAPRFAGSCDASGCTGLPSVASFLDVPSSAAFPSTPPSNAFNIGFMADNNLETPYTMNSSFSIQRELPGRVTLDLGYVGVQGRQLLAKIDMTMIGGILTDQQSGQTMWGAYRNVVNQMGPDIFNPSVDIFGAVFNADPTLLGGISEDAFFTNMMPNLPALAAAEASANFFGWCNVDSAGVVDPSCVNFIGGMTPTQAMYLYAATAAPSWVDPLYFNFNISPLVSPWTSSVDPEGDGFVLGGPQFGVLGGWINWDSSAYHSFQLSVRKNTENFQFTGNYVFSKSLDTGSAPENHFNPWGGWTQNPFRPKADRARSDFDLRHSFNASWVYELPFGRGQTFGSDAGSVLNHLIGGWQTSGIWRWRSGFPVSIQPGFAWATSLWFFPPTQLTGNARTRVTKSDANGVPNLFSDPDAARNAFEYTLPGGVGSRNVLSGPAFFQADLGLAKTTQVSERVRVQFRWEMFNAFNNVNFRDGRIPNNGGGVKNIETFFDRPSFGRIFRTFGSREMQFGIRIEF